jgi:ferrous iron transport protein B
MMRFFGLNGKSVIPLIGGMACAIPAIMAARSIDNKKDRLITTLVIPLMSCSARLPVYTLLLGLLIPAEAGTGIIDTRGLMLLFMYLIGFFASLLFALVFKWVLKHKDRSFFVLELPDYRWPRMMNVIASVRAKASDFVFGAGKIIIAISIVLWFLASNGPGDSMKKVDEQYAGYTMPDKEIKINAGKLESSYAGHLGHLIEPVIRPLGYDWKIGIALVTSFAAREVFVGTMATIYSVGQSEDKSIRGKLQEQVDPVSGTPVYNRSVVMSLLLFYAFAMQCMSTLAITWKETKSIKWALFQFLYMTAFAYVTAFLAYQIF